MTQPIEPAANSGHGHAVRFYESDRSLALIVAEFLQNGFAEGQPALIVAASPQRAAILRELNNRQADIVELQRSHRLILLDAQETLSTFMIDGVPDESKFMARMCEVIDAACDGHERTVRIYGQMVDVLWQRGEQDAAIRLEMLWNQLAQTKRYSLLCGYAMGHFYKDARLDEVCLQHTRVESDGCHAEMLAFPLARPATSDG